MSFTGFTICLSRLSSSHLLLFILLALAGSVAAQSGGGLSRNNPYSPSPVSRDRTVSSETLDKPANGQIAFVTTFVTTPRTGSPSNGREEPKKAVPVDTSYIRATETYSVGPGDVLYISITGKKEFGGYFTIRANGTISFPTIIKDLQVEGLEIQSIQRKLASALQLDDPQRVGVNVREFSSHRVLVKGLVLNAGEIVLRRDALPLFAIRAQAEVQPSAKKVIVKRTRTLAVEVYELSKIDDASILVYPGDTIEFAL